MPSAGYLRLSNLVKSYDGRSNAVDGIDLDIARGEFVTMLGPSGSGKTTTLMMIAGFEQPTGGAIELDGHDLAHSKPYQRNIGVVFQNYALFPHMTAARNIAFPLRMRHVAAAEVTRRVAAALALVGLDRFADKHPRELSGGQQQRVALARGLVFDPDVLLLDEPLGALDKNLREQMQVEIKRIHREVGITMIYVTHDQTEAMTMSDRIAVFNAGKLEQVGRPLDIYHRPATRFVGEFIGDSNFFPARVDPARPGWLEIDGIGPARLDGVDVASRGAVDLLVRPERLRLVETGGGAALNTLEMRVGTIVNYGDSVLAIGTTAGQPLRVRIAGTPPAALREGATVTVGWEPRDGHVVAHTANAT
ncbi:MAG TPA: ABC transporter ATP-binding protein [Candidatus Sulfotelmatobacter sp.]|nr:ABC transporter ATP-binding protein [Candidatus Sulfotelmatobacter sp.]